MSGRYSSSSRQSAETKCAASPGGTTRYCIAAWSAVNMTEDATATAANVNALHKFADKCGRMGSRGTERVDARRSASGPSLPPYCSFSIVEYDTSCGGQVIA